MSERNWERSPDFDKWRGCLFCKHLRWDDEYGGCAAYPNGTPLPIASGETDHLVLRPGQVGDTLYEDNGLTYEQVVARALDR